MPDYNKTIEYLFGLQDRGIKLGLDRTRRLLSMLGDPQESYPSIHVGGTNGKGSVSAMIAAILNETGVVAGLYTSPHLLSFTERIKVSGKEITEEEVVALTAEIMRALEEEGSEYNDAREVTFFELTTALAFAYFKRRAVELAVLEVGMGGRLDSTNTITPLVSVITNVSLDHTSSLGTELTSITKEKAGIIKKDGVVVTGASGVSLGVIEKAAGEEGAELYSLGKDFYVEVRDNGSFDYYGLDKEFLDLTVPLLGAHQYDNAALALAALEITARNDIAPSADELRRGLAKTRWPGRLELIEGEPAVLLDCAHNESAAKALAKAVSELKAEKGFGRVIVVLGVMNDKDIDAIIGNIAEVADLAVATSPRGERSAPPELLAEKLGAYIEEVYTSPTVKEAYQMAKSKAKPRDLILFTGSIFTVAEVEALLG